MPRHWILNCKSKVFDFESALKNEIIRNEGMTWKVSEEHKLIQPGDIYFLYSGVPHQAIVACGIIEEGVMLQECDENSSVYWKDHEKGKIAPRIYISIGHIFDPYVEAGEINPEGTKTHELVPLGQQGSNKQISPSVALRLRNILNIEID